MLINFYKKITPTMRYRNRLVIFKNKFFKKKTNTNIVLSNSGRGLGGNQTVYTKKHSIKKKSCSFSFKDIFYSRHCYVRWVNLITKTKKKVTIMSSWDNKVFCLPHVFGVSPGMNFKFLDFYLKIFNILKFGVPCFLKLIPDYYKISSITSLFKHKPTYAVSSGCFCTKIPKKKKDKLLKIILPSKLVKFFKLNDFCFIGKNDLMSKKLIQPGKAGFTSNSGVKSKVRGVAMNPVDHPNGGRTKSPSPEKSPWGWTAKLNK